MVGVHKSSVSDVQAFMLLVQSHARHHSNSNQTGAEF